MLRDKTSDVETLTNLGADRLKMGIDMDGLVHITDLLTNMYSDEELAVLREYSTNALDAHKQAGQTRPIEVTLPCGTYDLPTEERPRTLKIQDWGTGLSTEELAEVYSLYGKSTKDDSNEYNGMMGIGGKSGLVSTFGTFTITAVKDGTKTVVHVGRDEATEPVMDLVSVSETDEPNGVTIELPAPRRNGLRNKAAALFQFWPEGTVLVDGQPPQRLKPKLKINDNVWIVDRIDTVNYSATDWIVMANVPYPVDMGANLADGYSLVVFASTGAVSIAPSREALRMTQKTKDEIARLRAEYDQAVKSVMQDAVNKAKNRAEAIRIALEWRKTFASDGDFTVKFGKVTLPTWVQVGEVTVRNARKDDRVAGGIIVTRHGDHKKSRHDRQEKIFIGTLMDAVLVEGYPVDTVFTSVHKQKLEQWAKDRGIKPEHYILTKKRLAHGWTDPKYRVQWETVKKIKRQNAGGNGPYAIRGSYPMYIANEWFNHHPAVNIDVSNPVFWCDSSWMGIRYGYGSRSIRELLFERYPNATVVELTNNRINKFKRDFPMARRANVIIDEIYADIRDSVSPLKLKRFAIEEDSNVGLLRRLDVDRVDDPAIKKAIRWSKTKFDRKAKEELDRRLRETGRYYDHDMKFEWKNPINKYPLANSSKIEHTYLYMNAVYAAEVNNR